jgi:hypothetical protein
MNKIKKLFTLTLIVGFTINASGQATATATATATIITPITIANAGDMNFGNIAVQDGTGGTVVLIPAGTATSTGGVTLPSTQGNIAAASFTVGGQTGYAYSISLPNSHSLSGTGAATMTLGTFTSTSAGTFAAGSETINVGATLTVAPAQAPGVYTSSTGFDVTVNYN